MKPLGGPHHFTGVTADVQTNVDFWCRVMGLRFVKNTLNYETTFRYHTYFGDEDGNPGSVVTFLEFEEAPRGVPGRGDIQRSLVRSDCGLEVRRLTSGPVALPQRAAQAVEHGCLNCR